MVQCQREFAQQNGTLVYCNTVQSSFLPSCSSSPPPFSIFSKSTRWGYDKVLVTAYNTPGVSQQTQQTHPGEVAPNWADTFATTEANERHVALHQRGPWGLGVWEDKRLFTETLISPTCYVEMITDEVLYLLILGSQTHRFRWCCT